MCIVHSKETALQTIQNLIEFNKDLGLTGFKLRNLVVQDIADITARKYVSTLRDKNYNVEYYKALKKWRSIAIQSGLFI